MHDAPATTATAPAKRKAVTFAVSPPKPRPPLAAALAALNGHAAADNDDDNAAPMHRRASTTARVAAMRDVLGRHRTIAGRVAGKRRVVSAEPRPVHPAAVTAVGAARSISLLGTEELHGLTALAVLTAHGVDSGENAPADDAVFDAPDTDADVRRDPATGDLVGASAVKLVACLTQPSGADAALLDDVLLNLPAVVPPGRFAALLLLRAYWCLRPNDRLDVAKVLRATLYRTLAVLAAWIEAHADRDAPPQSPLRMQLQVNLQMLLAARLHPEAKAVVLAVLETLNKTDSSSSSSSSSSNAIAIAPAPAPTTPNKRRPRSSSTLGQRLSRSISQTRRRSVSISQGMMMPPVLEADDDAMHGQGTAASPAATAVLLGTSSRLLCDQLCALEQRLFLRVRLSELDGLVWTKDDRRRTEAPHVVAVIDRFNDTSQWVASEILNEPGLEARTQLLEKFIRVADKCREAHNYASCMQIALALQKQEVYRLQRTWKKIGTYERGLWKSLQELTSPTKNWAQLRQAQAASVASGAPVVPFTGLFLSDLIFNAELPSTIAPHNGLINVRKHRLRARVLRELLAFQRAPPYAPEPVGAGGELAALRLQIVPGLPDEQLMELSRRREP